MGIKIIIFAFLAVAIAITIAIVNGMAKDPDFTLKGSDLQLFNFISSIVSAVVITVTILALFAARN